MNATRNKPPFDAGRAAYLTLNGLLLVFLLAPIAIVLVFALNPTPYISFPPVGVTTRRLSPIERMKSSLAKNFSNQRVVTPTGGKEM